MFAGAISSSTSRLGSAAAASSAFIVVVTAARAVHSAAAGGLMAKSRYDGCRLACGNSEMGLLWLMSNMPKRNG